MSEAQISRNRERLVRVDLQAQTGGFVIAPKINFSDNPRRKQSMPHRVPIVVTEIQSEIGPAPRVPEMTVGCHGRVVIGTKEHRICSLSARAWSRHLARIDTQAKPALTFATTVKCESIPRALSCQIGRIDISQCGAS